MSTLTLIAFGLCLVSLIILIASLDHYNTPQDKVVEIPKDTEVREFYIRCEYCMDELEMIYENAIKPNFLVALKYGEDCPTHNISSKESSDD